MDSNLLQKVIFLTDVRYAPESFVIDRLIEGGISVVCFSIESDEWQDACLKEDIEGDKKGILLITDSSDIYLKYRDRFPIYAYFHEGISSAQFSDAIYVLEGLDDTDDPFLEGIYRRLRDIPWLIGKSDDIEVREMMPEDAEDIHALYRTDEKWYMDNLEVFGQSIEETKEYLKDYRQNRYGIYGYGMWVITDSLTEEVIGMVGFQNTDKEDELELGFMVKKEYRRRGIAFKACKLALDYIQRFAPEMKIVCVIHKDNIPAQELVNKLKEEKFISFIII